MIEILKEFTSYTKPITQSPFGWVAADERLANLELYMTRCNSSGNLLPFMLCSEPTLKFPIKII